MAAIVAKTAVPSKANYAVGGFVRSNPNAPGAWPSVLRRMSIIANDARRKASGAASGEAADSATRRPSGLPIALP